MLFSRSRKIFARPQGMVVVGRAAGGFRQTLSYMVFARFRNLRIVTCQSFGADWVEGLAHFRSVLQDCAFSLPFARQASVCALHYSDLHFFGNSAICMFQLGGCCCLCRILSIGPPAFAPCEVVATRLTLPLSMLRHGRWRRASSWHVVGDRVHGGARSL